MWRPCHDLPGTRSEIRTEGLACPPGTSSSSPTQHNQPNKPTIHKSPSNSIHPSIHPSIAAPIRSMCGRMHARIKSQSPRASARAAPRGAVPLEAARHGDVVGHPFVGWCSSSCSCSRLLARQAWPARGSIVEARPPARLTEARPALPLKYLGRAPRGDTSDRPLCGRRATSARALTCVCVFFVVARPRRERQGQRAGAIG